VYILTDQTMVPLPTTSFLALWQRWKQTKNSSHEPAPTVHIAIEQSSAPPSPSPVENNRERESIHATPAPSPYDYEPELEETARQAYELGFEASRELSRLCDRAFAIPIRKRARQGTGEGVVRELQKAELTWRIESPGGAVGGVMMRTGRERK
jgi:hypothetical protein